LCLKRLKRILSDFWCKGRRQIFDVHVNVALANLEFHIHITTEYICRQCHGVLKKRSNLQQNLENLQKSMRINSATRLEEFGLWVRRGFDSKATAAHFRLEINNPCTPLQYCEMEVTSLHDFYGSWHLYICHYILSCKRHVT